MNLKKWITAVSATAILACTMPVHVHADEDFSDTTYWTERCTNISNLRGSDKQNCEVFLQKMAEQSDSLSAQLNEIDSQRSEIAANIEEYANKIEEYQNQIDDLKVQIDDLQGEIDSLQENIEEKQAEADDLETKVMNQIENSQPTMRLSKVIDVLMGAKTFTELIQIINGLSDMTEYNDRTMDNLVAVMQELKDTQKQLDDKQTELESTQEEALVSQYQAQVIQDEYEAQKAELEKRAQEVLDVRDQHFDMTLGEQYNPETMPETLKEAHHRLDLAVERCYRPEPFSSDEERLECLFKLYAKMTKK